MFTVRFPAALMAKEGTEVIDPVDPSVSYDVHTVSDGGVANLTIAKNPLGSSEDTLAERLKIYLSCLK